MTVLCDDPTGLELVLETTPQDFVEPLLRMFGSPGNLPQDIVDRIRNEPSEIIGPLLDAKKAEDTLWFCRSEKRAPLYGHEGIALVRDGRPIVYLRLINY